MIDDRYTVDRWVDKTLYRVNCIYVGGGGWVVGWAGASLAADYVHASICACVCACVCYRLCADVRVLVWDSEDKLG